MKRVRNTSIYMLFVCLFTCHFALAQNSQKKPNFVWLVSEDNSPQYIQLFDKSGAKMPNIEALAQNGIIFEQTFSNTPVCSTARTTLATGVETPRFMLNYHRKFSPVVLPEDLKPISRYLMDAGYYAANNFKTDFNFEVDSEKAIWNDSGTSASWRNRGDDQPFFYMQSWSTTHEKNLHFPESDIGSKPTMHAPENVTLPPYYPDTDAFKYTYARYLDQHSKVDKEIGAVVQKLEEDNLLDDTFIFYFGDHGGVMPGTKGYIYERGLHVPLVVHVPKNYAHLVNNVKGNVRQRGIVNFVDFAPTLAHLADLPQLPMYDGKPFLGENITFDNVATRDTAFAYADRFDEKYDFVRAYRKGKYKYVRNFTPMNTDGLFNEYRYKQFAYREWKAMYHAGKLNPVQASFFEIKPPEALYDLEKDPHETQNLIAEKAIIPVVKEMRSTLFEHLQKQLDLGFFPEYWLVQHAAKAPLSFAQQNKQTITQLIKIANLQLLPFSEAKSSLIQALKSDNQWHRYWALINLSVFKEEAKSLSAMVHDLLLKENNALIQARAVEFLTLTSNFDPVPHLLEYVSNTEDIILILEIMNIAAVLHEAKGYNFDIPMRKNWVTPKKGQDNYEQMFNATYWLGTRIRYLASSRKD